MKEIVQKQELEDRDFEFGLNELFGREFDSSLCKLGDRNYFILMIIFQKVV